MFCCSGLYGNAIFRHAQDGRQGRPHCGNMGREFGPLILEEYQEIIEQQTTARIAENVILLILNRRNVNFVDPHFRLGLITEDPDDNKFVDCAFAANAEYLVSDDKHFKILDRIPFPQINLLKMEEFLPIVSTL